MVHTRSSSLSLLFHVLKRFSICTDGPCRFFSSFHNIYPQSKRIAHRCRLASACRHLGPHGRFRFSYTRLDFQPASPRLHAYSVSLYYTKFCFRRSSKRRLLEINLLRLHHKAICFSSPASIFCNFNSPRHVQDVESTRKPQRKSQKSTYRHKILLLRDLRR